MSEKISILALRDAAFAHSFDATHALAALESENTKLREQAIEQQAALTAALPFIESQNDAEHMLDGLGGRRSQRSDGVLGKVRATLAKWRIE